MTNAAYDLPNQLLCSVGSNIQNQKTKMATRSIMQKWTPRKMCVNSAAGLPFTRMLNKRERTIPSQSKANVTKTNGEQIRYIFLCAFMMRMLHVRYGSFPTGRRQRSLPFALDASLAVLVCVHVCRRQARFTLLHNNWSTFDVASIRAFAYCARHRHSQCEISRRWILWACKATENQSEPPTLYVYDREMAQHKVLCSLAIFHFFAFALYVCTVVAIYRDFQFARHQFTLDY